MNTLKIGTVIGFALGLTSELLASGTFLPPPPPPKPKAPVEAPKKCDGSNAETAECKKKND